MTEAIFPFRMYFIWEIICLYSSSVCLATQGALQLPMWYSKHTLNLLAAMLVGERFS